MLLRYSTRFDAVLTEIAAMNAKIDALGIILDSDPRRVTKTGIEPFNSLDVSLRVLPPGGLPRAAE